MTPGLRLSRSWLIALLVPGASGCVEDVWLGPERLALRAVDAGDAAEPDAGGADAGGALDAGFDADLDADAAVDQDAGADPDAGEPTTAPAFCSQNSCLIVSLGKDNASCERGAPRTCWPSDLGFCAVACSPEARCGRDEDAPCDAGFYCNLTNLDEECNVGGLGGYCTPYPKSCQNEQTSPVCGCDGRTYASECIAARAGMSVAALWACEDAAP